MKRPRRELGLGVASLPRRGLARQCQTSKCALPALKRGTKRLPSQAHTLITSNRKMLDDDNFQSNVVIIENMMPMMIVKFRTCWT